MSAHAPADWNAQLVLDPSLRVRLEKLAAASGRDASELVVAVLRAFLDENDRHLQAIDAGIEEADAGQLLDYEDVKAAIQSRAAPLLL